MSDLYLADLATKITAAHRNCYIMPIHAQWWVCLFVADMLVLGKTALTYTVPKPWMGEGAGDQAMAIALAAHHIRRLHPVPG